MNYRSPLLSVLPLLTSLALPAAWAGENCTNPVTSSELVECADQEGALAEKELNLVYRRVVKALGEQEASFSKEYPDLPRLSLKADLVAAQRAWLVYRAQSCQLEGKVVLSGNPSRGDSEAITVTGCEANMATARTKELREFAQTYGVTIAP